MILPAGGGAFAACAAFAAGFFAGAFTCTVCLLSCSMVLSHAGVSPQLHTLHEARCFSVVTCAVAKELGH